MDRRTAYFGQEPLIEDYLQAQQNAMVGIAKLSETVFGTPVLVDGFTCTTTTPPSLNVLLTPGSIYQLENLESSPWSTLPTDGHSIVKQGILLDPFQIGINKPATGGFSQIYLIQVQYADLDTGATTLPYFNAARSPGSPFDGPGNAGTVQNTARKGIVAIQAKAGIAAPTGSQVAPAPDPGWTGLFLVTVASSDTAVSTGSITTLSSAPFLPTNGKLPQIPTGVLNGSWIGADDTGTANNLVVTLSNPTPAAYVKYMGLRVKIAALNTGATTISHERPRLEGRRSQGRIVADRRRSPGRRYRRDHL